MNQASLGDHIIHQGCTSVSCLASFVQQLSENLLHSQMKCIVELVGLEEGQKSRQNVTCEKWGNYLLVEN